MPGESSESQPVVSVVILGPVLTACSTKNVLPGSSVSQPSVAASSSQNSLQGSSGVSLDVSRAEVTCGLSDGSSIWGAKMDKIPLCIALPFFLIQASPLKNLLLLFINKSSYLYNYGNSYLYYIVAPICQIGQKSTTDFIT